MGKFFKSEFLQKMLNYLDDKEFLAIVEKAKKSFIADYCDVSEHFIKTKDGYEFSAYACFLICKNADETKIYNAKHVFLLTQLQAYKEKNLGDCEYFFLYLHEKLQNDFL